MHLKNKKESVERAIRYTEGRAQIKIKKRSEGEKSSQNDIMLGFGIQSPTGSPGKNCLEFKDNLNDCHSEILIRSLSQKDFKEDDKVGLEIDD